MLKAKVLIILGAVIGIIALPFALPLISALVGAFSGWVVGWFFSQTVLTFFAGLGITGLETWQLGLTLGFIGGFFKSTLSLNKD